MWHPLNQRYDLAGVGSASFSAVRRWLLLCNASGGRRSHAAPANQTREVGLLWSLSFGLASTQQTLSSRDKNSSCVDGYISMSAKQRQQRTRTGATRNRCKMPQPSVIMYQPLNPHCLVTLIQPSATVLSRGCKVQLIPPHLFFVAIVTEQANSRTSTTWRSTALILLQETNTGSTQQSNPC